MADTEPALPFAGVPKQVVYENTYITTPEGYGPVRPLLDSYPCRPWIWKQTKVVYVGIASAECDFQEVQGASSAQADTQGEDGKSAI